MVFIYRDEDIHICLEVRFQSNGLLRLSSEKSTREGVEVEETFYDAVGNEVARTPRPTRMELCGQFREEHALAVAQSKMRNVFKPAKGYQKTPAIFLSHFFKDYPRIAERFPAEKKEILPSQKGEWLAVKLTKTIPGNTKGTEVLLTLFGQWLIEV